MLPRVLFRLASISRPVLQSNRILTRPSILQGSAKKLNYFSTSTCQKQSITKLLFQKYNQQKLSTSFISNGSLKQKFMSTVAFNAQHASANTATASAITHTKPIVGYWLYFNASLVFTIVVVGGLTRLTESGLSIVEWNVISGMKPPRSEQEWRDEFEKYKQYPEYKILNRHMTLDEFKGIFYWEWGHRMIGRFIGMTLVLPAIYFARRGYMTKTVQKQVLFILSVMGFQGFMGWYMVKSGLNEALMKEVGAVPRVSQYRLTAHLCTALVIYAGTIFTAAGVIRADKIARGVYPKQVAEMINSPILGRFRRYTHLLGGLMFITALSGGIVAGLDAGLIYNEYPKMGTGFVPPKDELWDDRFKKQGDNGKWRNLLENPVTAQFDHRTLAELTAVSTAALWAYSRRLPLPKNVKNAMNAMVGAAALQVTLGICTLIYMVPISLGAAHQAGALVLLTSNFWLIHALRRVPL